MFDRLRRGTTGTAAIELGLVLPLLVVILVGILDYGHIHFTRLAMTNAAREGARAGVTTVSATGLGVATQVGEEHHPAPVAAVRRAQHPAPLPQLVEPDDDPAVERPAELVRELPAGEGWQYEPKWDGFRGVLENDGGELALWSRNARPLLRYFPELAPLGDAPFESILWQSIVGAWPASRERLHAYAEKAIREAQERVGDLADDRDPHAIRRPAQTAHQLAPATEVRRRSVEAEGIGGRTYSTLPSMRARRPTRGRRASA